MGYTNVTPMTLTIYIMVAVNGDFHDVAFFNTL